MEACKGMKKRNWWGEQGAIMLEGMIVMVITLFVLIWVLGLGFVYYQRYITTVVTNDAATKIASTYNNIDSDIIMGYVNTEALTGRNLYRRFSADTLHGANEDRAAAYVRYILDKANFVGVVDSVEEAAAHISAHSTGHSDAIVTADPDAAAYFAAMVDSAAVYWNASTRYTDGGEFGLGCEIGISTQKLHPRGPMGLEELCSYKYIITGSGQVR